MTLTQWTTALKRTWSEASEDNVGLIAAGVAFYAFLAIVPLLGAAVLSYGLVATPETVLGNLRSLTTVMPADAARLIGEQLLSIVTTSSGKKGFGLLVALAVALFGARNGAGSLVTALNIVYEEKEKRGFLKVNLLALAMTAASIVAILAAVVAIAAMGRLEAIFGEAPAILLTLGRFASYAVMILVGAAGAAALYRYGPSRPDAKWQWLTPGSVLAAVVWALLTLGFGYYVANFGNYNATYGSLGAVVVLLTWIWLSAYVLLLGAELNAELERQEAGPTTAEPGVPAIKRGEQATSADTPPDDRVASDGRGPSRTQSFALQRVGVRAGRMSGGAKVGLATPAIAALGLSWLKRGRGKQGLAALGAVAALAWLRRKDEDGRGR